MNPIRVENCPYCGAKTGGKLVFARLESFDCADCGRSGKLNDAGLWTPPPLAKEVPHPLGGFALVFPPKHESAHPDAKAKK